MMMMMMMIMKRMMIAYQFDKSPHQSAMQWLDGRRRYSTILVFPSHAPKCSAADRET
jgi:hypothetical protein